MGIGIRLWSESRLTDISHLILGQSVVVDPGCVDGQSESGTAISKIVGRTVHEDTTPSCHGPRTGFLGHCNTYQCLSL